MEKDRKYWEQVLKTWEGFNPVIVKRARNALRLLNQEEAKKPEPVKKQVVLKEEPKLKPKAKAKPKAKKSFFKK